MIFEVPINLEAQLLLYQSSTKIPVKNNKHVYAAEFTQDKRKKQGKTLHKDDLIDLEEESLHLVKNQYKVTLRFIASNIG